MKVLRDLFTDYRFFFSFFVLVIILILAILSFFSPYDPTLWGVVPKNLSPSMKYLLGTDSNGQDIFWQATFAVRNSLIISLIAASVSRVIAVLVGMVAGYARGNTDRLLMFISDGLLVIPLFLILVMLAMMVRQHMNLVVLGLLLSFFGWAWDARVIRSRFHQDGYPFRYGDSQTGIKRVPALCHAVNLLDVDQQHILGDWVGNDTGTPWIGQC